MNPHDVERQRGELLLVDVREPYEWAAGHLEGSLHMPMTAVPERWEELKTDRPIIVVCHLGQRSAVVVDFLRHRGIEAENLEGGLEEWMRQGLSVTPPDLGPRDAG